VGIPSAPKGDGALVNIFTAIGRWQDFPLIGPDTLWLRPGLALRAGGRDLFVQADLGVDIAIKVGDSGTKKAFFHGNAGIGTTQGPVALTAEFATIAYDTSSATGDGDVEFFHSVGASIRYVGGDVQPFLSYVLPFHFGDPVPGHVITAGVQGAF
jgi:hypothetical protein